LLLLKESDIYYEGSGTGRKFPVLKILGQCTLAPLSKLGWLEGKALGSEEVKKTGNRQFRGCVTEKEG
jgi:hypothetical protein